MRKSIQDSLQVLAAILITGSTAFAMQPTEASLDASVEQSTSVEKEPSQPTPEVEPAPVAAPSVEPVATVVAEPEPAPQELVASPEPVSNPVDNESRIWNFFAGQGFSREQVAGIMGNLQQEHNFNTSDEPGGLGIAQWMGGRRQALINKGDYLNLDVQLAFVMEEMNGSHQNAGLGLRASFTVEEAVRAFQNHYERCGTCMEGQRVEFAYGVLGRH